MKFGFDLDFLRCVAASTDSMAASRASLSQGESTHFGIYRTEQSEVLEVYSLHTLRSKVVITSPSYSQVGLLCMHDFPSDTWRCRQQEHLTTEELPRFFS